MTAPPFRSEFEQVLRPHLRLLDPGEPIPFDTEFVAIGVDSLDTINLLLDIEDTFEVAFPTALLSAEVFRTPSTLEQALASLVTPGD